MVIFLQIIAFLLFMGSFGWGILQLGKQRFVSSMGFIIVGVCLSAYAMFNVIEVEGNMSVKPVIQYVLLFLTAIITYFAFHVQYVYNKIQRDDLKKERFENNFFSYLNLLVKHEELCSVEGVGNGKQAFHFMFYEFKALCYIFKRSGLFRAEKDGVSMLQGAAFNYFINGASLSCMDRLKEEDNTGIDERALEKLHEQILQYQKRAKKETWSSAAVMPDYLKDYPAGLTLFDGHRLRLIPYFRIVCICVEYLYDFHNDDATHFNFFRKAFIAQFSEHQLAMLIIIHRYSDSDTLGFITNKTAVDDFFHYVQTSFLKAKTMNIDNAGFLKD